MARIVFVTMHYPPEIGAAQTHISETAEGLARRGHEVIVLTTLPNYPSGRVFPEYREESRRIEEIKGVRVIRVWSYISPKRGFLHRLLGQLSFGYAAPRAAKALIGQADMVIAVSPLLAALGGRGTARQLRCPFIFNVADLWPEVAIQLGALRNRMAIRVAEHLEMSMYRQAAAVWSVTEGIRQNLIQRGISPEHVFTIPIGADSWLLRPQSRASARSELGWDDRFTVVHAGNIALAHGLSVVLETAELLGSRPDIRIVLVGDSATGTRAELMAEAQRRGLNNITFVGQQPHERIPTFIAAADACLVSVKKVPILEGALPVKMFEAMSCGRALVLAVDGEARQMAVEDARAGVFAEPENPKAIAAGIIHLYDHRDECDALGAHGRAYIEAHLDREILTDTLYRHIGTLLGQTQSQAVFAVHAGIHR